ncbi:hypothetical protein [Jeotgalibacillus campisalis]|uniref:Uncharacterized protein n=1 Tax=Jeotgalibacillus campisalis TaxID=220754 RepID=A0A0C2VGW0_9BACL|nr:hypothetical protein [Jeotgalibacillus campisalis]KIL43248.1 hypothetical protein KR50_36510 [Jeotgalibacillus campisalis]
MILFIMVMSSMISFVCLLFQVEFISRIEKELYYPMGSWWSWWESIHLNSLYFNLYTFLLGMSVSVLIAGALAVNKKRGV